MGTEIIISEEECITLSDHISKLLDQVGDIPDSFLEKKGDNSLIFYPCEPRFDITKFLDIFDSVQLENGCVLDYFYYYDGLGGFPIPFTRKEDHDPTDILKKLAGKKQPPRIPNLMQNIEFSKTASGYFQFSVFKTVIHQFYLFWHAGYNDLEFVFSKQRLNSILELIKESREDTSFETEMGTLEALELNPRVKIYDMSARVSMVTFTQWGGLFCRHTHVTWPNRIDDFEEELLLHYDCSIIF